MANYIRSAEAAKMLDLSISTLYAMCRAHRIPHYRVGTLLFFDQDELSSWVRQFRITPEAELRKTINSR